MTAGMHIEPLTHEIDNRIVNMFMLIEARSKSHIAIAFAKGEEEKDRALKKVKELRTYNRKGLLPRQMRYILGSYRPKPEQLSEYRAFGEIRDQLKVDDKISAQCLGNRLKALVEREILKKRNRRYVKGRSFSTNDWKIDDLKTKLNGTLRKFWRSEHGVVWFVRPNWFKASGLPNDFRDKLNRELEQIVERMHLEWLRTSGDKSPDYLNDDIKSFRRKKFPIFPLIVIDPNNMMILPDAAIALDEAFEEWERESAIPSVPDELRTSDGETTDSLSKMKKPIFAYR